MLLLLQISVGWKHCLWALLRRSRAWLQELALHCSLHNKFNGKKLSHKKNSLALQDLTRSVKRRWVVPSTGVELFLKNISRLWRKLNSNKTRYKITQVVIVDRRAVKRKLKSKIMWTRNNNHCCFVYLYNRCDCRLTVDGKLERGKWSQDLRYD